MSPVLESEKFQRSTRLARSGGLLTLRGQLPGERANKGESVDIEVIAKDSQHIRRIRLKTKLAEGGEGSIFSTSIAGYVAKVYQRDKITVDRKEKLTRMISKQISCDGVCFPEALILNGKEEFVGYLMREARGFELGKSVFQPKLLLQRFPSWTKRDTIDLCITILEKIDYLNKRNIILGDINPANILVVSPSIVYFVDCDSYQIEGYPCPVGTANFTPPEAQGKDYKTFLRTQEMENFAIATLLFMIMLPGKPPYSAVGGASPERNIREGVFPYPHKETETDKTPPGKWGYIWSHMSYKMRLAFYESFRKGESHFAPSDRYSAEEWLGHFKDYRYAIGQMVKNDDMSVNIFPTREKKKKCKQCGSFYVPNRDNYTPYCSKCDVRYSRSSRSSYIPTSGASKYSSPRAGGVKLCPYCSLRYISAGESYCIECKNKVLRQRECVNCHKQFPITVGLDAWEKARHATRRQCDVCKEACCTADPCRHAQRSASFSSQPSKPSHPPAASKVQWTQNQAKSTPKVTAGKNQAVPANTKKTPPAASKVQWTQNQVKPAPTVTAGKNQAVPANAKKTSTVSSSNANNWKRILGGFFYGVVIGWAFSPITWGALFVLLKLAFPDGLNPGVSLGSDPNVFFIAYFAICGAIGAYKSVHDKSSE